MLFDGAVPRGPIVVLTGAGISHESGLDTYRGHAAGGAPDPGSIWARYRLEEVATPQAFARDPARVHAFYDERRRQLTGDASIRPNAAHAALAELERRLGASGGDENKAGNEDGDALLLVTQNVDDLHERAGSRSLVHLHGELLRARCTACGATAPIRTDLADRPPCPACARCALRPDIVWFGEMPMQMERVMAALSRCALFVAIGTSGSVHPAAGFIDLVPEGAMTLELKLEPTAITGHFTRAVQGPATRLVPQLVDELLAARG